MVVGVVVVVGVVIGATVSEAGVLEPRTPPTGPLIVPPTKAPDRAASLYSACASSLSKGNPACARSRTA